MGHSWYRLSEKGLFLSLYLTPLPNLRTMNEQAELANGRWAMIGIMAALGSYAFTGQIIPGVF